MNVLRNGFHVVGGKLLDHAVHDGRVAKLVLDHLKLANDIGRMLSGQPREDGSPLGAIAVTGCAGDEAVRAFLRSKVNARVPMPGGEDIAKRYTLFEAKLPAAAKARKISLKEVKSWKYVNDVQAIMATWIRDNPSPI